MMNRTTVIFGVVVVAVLAVVAAVAFQTGTDIGVISAQVLEVGRRV